MAAASDDRNTEFWGAPISYITAPIYAAKKIYAGTMVCANASGYAVPGGHAATESFLGIAMEQKDNKDGANGALSVEIALPPAVFKMSFITVATATTLSQEKVGSTAYVVDDQNLTLSTAQTADNTVGKVVKYISASEAWVRIS